MKNSVNVLATLALSAFVFGAHAQTGGQTTPAAGTTTGTTTTDGTMSDTKMAGTKMTSKKHSKMHHGKMAKSGTKMKAKM